MHTCNHNIGCLSVEVFPLTENVDVNCFSLTDKVPAECFPLSERVKPSAFLICSVNQDSFIRFKESMLSWYGRDNNEGVIKYNTLTASGKWTLEEVEIEELL